MTKMEITKAEAQRMPADNYRHYKRQLLGGSVILIIGALIEHY